MYVIEFCYRCQPDTFNLIKFEEYDVWIEANEVLFKAVNILVIRGYKLST